MQGLHLTSDLYDCQADQALLIDADVLASLCSDATIAAGLTIVGEKWHTFPDYQGQPGGVTGMLLLAESHLAVHTWPERAGVTLDVYVCNFESDNSARAQELLDTIERAFKPGQSQRQRLMRGDAAGPAVSGNFLFENLNADSTYGFRFERTLLARNTGLQQLEVLQSSELGRTLRLDGCLMTSQADEAFYHEPLIHPAALAHANPTKALIIGGGDGGALEELLKHPSLREISLVEYDPQVIEVAREYLQDINKGSLDDPRVTLVIADGAQFVRTSSQRFDLVYLDLTDPETAAGPLYTSEFFAACKNILNDGGALVLHLGSFFHEAEQVVSMTQKLRSVFAQVHGYGVHIPIYGTFWALAVAADSLDPTAVTAAQIEQRMSERGIDGLEVYSPQLHGALFTLPVRYQRLLGSNSD